MEIKYSSGYKLKALKIFDYIALDNKKSSQKFDQEIHAKIQQLTPFPYAYKQSSYFDDEDIREMTYKKYSIVYRINILQNHLELLTIFKTNKPNATN